MGEAILQPLFHALDPVSLILSQNTSQSDQPIPLSLTTTDAFFWERGPRYKEYSELRDSKLRLKGGCFKRGEDKDCNFKQTPPRKQVKFQTCNLGPKKVGSFSSSVLTQSVPDFTATLRKENRKPPVPSSPQELTLTPPGSGSKNWPNSKVGGGVLSGSKGSKSADSGGEKRNRNGTVGGLMARKSCASFEELRGLGLVASSAINGENKGSKCGGSNKGLGYGKAVLGYRQF